MKLVLPMLGAIATVTDRTMRQLRRTTRQHRQPRAHVSIGSVEGRMSAPARLTHRTGTAASTIARTAPADNDG